jgi:hypothetical protein
MSPNEASYFCPKCQSPLVTLSVLTGGRAHCEKCEWSGDNRDLIGYQFQSGFDNPDEILRAFAHDIKMLMARGGMAVEIGQLIIKWGFVTKMTVPILSRYVAAIARGIASAVLEERMKIEKEEGASHAARTAS